MKGKKITYFITVTLVVFLCASVGHYMDQSVNSVEKHYKNIFKNMILVTQDNVENNVSYLKALVFSLTNLSCIELRFIKLEYWMYSIERGKSKAEYTNNTPKWNVLKHLILTIGIIHSRCRKNTFSWKQQINSHVQCSLCWTIPVVKHS